MTQKLGWGAVLLAATLACGEEDGSYGRAPDGGTLDACSWHDAIAVELGCTPLAGECELDEACDEAGRAWLACVERDLTQCRCESDEDRELNCEGSFKPDEGPARCKAEYERLATCQGE